MMVSFNKKVIKLTDKLKISLIGEMSEWGRICEVDVNVDTFSQGTCVATFRANMWWLDDEDNEYNRLYYMAENFDADNCNEKTVLKHIEASLILLKNKILKHPMSKEKYLEFLLVNSKESVIDLHHHLDDILEDAGIKLGEKIEESNLRQVKVSISLTLSEVLKNLKEIIEKDIIRSIS